MTDDDLGPDWDDEIIARADAAQHSKSKGKGTNGNPDAAADLARGAARQAQARELQAALEAMNERYFVVGVSGRVLIASIEEDVCLQRRRLVFMRRSDLALRYENRLHTVGLNAKGQEIRKDLATIWLKHQSRRTYDRHALLPNQEAPPDVYNLWQGWGIEPRPGTWDTIHAFLLTVICAGNELHLAYLLGWIAHCVQHPERQAEVAVVLKGLKGTGKGTLGRLLLRIFKHHGLQIASGKHLTGQFNAHLNDCLYLFVDEAFWAGDKAAEGVLKGLITEPVMMIEAKGVDPIMVPNRLKLVIATNNEWVVPATKDERRYFVLEVSDVRKDDHHYFDRVNAAIDGEEGAAFLHEMLTLDLEGFKIRAMPHTKGLASQKLLGADSVIRFWYACLTEGAIIGTDDMEWPPHVVTQVLHAAFLDHAHNHGDRHPVEDWQMAHRLAELWPGGALTRIRPRIRTIGPNGDPVLSRPPCYRLQSLDAHRAAFLKAMRIDPAEHPWPVVEDDHEQE